MHGRLQYWSVNRDATPGSELDIYKVLRFQMPCHYVHFLHGDSGGEHWCVFLSTSRWGFTYAVMQSYMKQYSCQ